MGFTRRQWQMIINFSITNFCSACCISLQAPFYPLEAEKKGANATEYGFVFGVFQLVVSIVSPIYGKYMNVVGPKLMFNLGIYTTATCCIAFGFLDRIEDKDAFIGWSFALRVLEALGESAVPTVVYGIVAMEFPDDMGSIFAWLMTCFGVGLIAGPTLGGALYELGEFTYLGAYTLPFVVLGSVMLLAATTTIFLLPKAHGGTARKGSVLSLLKVPALCVFGFAMLSSSLSIGFIQACLEPHLRPLGLAPVRLGSMFIIQGGFYAISGPLWGWLADNYLHPRWIVCIGSVIGMVAFLLMGPVPFMGLDTTLELVIISLTLMGLGLGASATSGFTGMQRDAIAHGFPDDMSTSGLVSGLWTSAFTFGLFLGPSIGGVLLDQVGFDWGAFFVVIMHFLVIVVILIHYCCVRGRENNYSLLYESVAEDVHIRSSESSKTASGNYGSIAKEEHLVAKVAGTEPALKSGEYEAISEK